MKFMLQAVIYITIAAFSLKAQPVIEIWYGNPQYFGFNGTPQNQINILGRVTGATSLSYTLNGSDPRSLNIGPYTPTTVRRLYNTGDFNIEIFTNTLNGYSRDEFLVEGENTVTVTAQGTGGPVNEIVTFSFTDDYSLPSSYSVDFDTVTNITNIFQVTDGKWELVPGEGVRNSSGETGYDRALIFGDKTWENYEVNVKVKINEVLEKMTSPSGGASLIMILRWNGHTDNPVSGWEPKSGWIPTGAFIDYVPREHFSGSSFNEGIFEVFANGEGTGQTYIDDFTLDTWYNFKARIQSRPGDSPIIKAKLWKDGTTEPDWQLVCYNPDRLQEPLSGAVLFGAHHLDVTFGDFFVVPLEPLPVELTAFTGKVSNQEILLNWETSSEVNNYMFEIEKNVSGSGNKIWVTIGQIIGNGNSNSKIGYSFKDKNPVKGKNCYRLKQIDVDGSFKYSDEITIEYYSNRNFELIQNYPNPFNPATTISYFLPQEADVTIEIISSLGETIEIIKRNNEKSGLNKYIWDAGNLPSGVYFYKVKAVFQNSNTINESFNKMLLVK